MSGRRSGTEGEDKRLEGNDLDYWLQKLIACVLTIGISKRELLYDYYMDEIGEVIYEHNHLHKTGDKKAEVVEEDCDSFFGFF